MPSILLVEDDEALARNLTQFLTAEGFSVKHGSGQRAGMQLFLSDSFDCVLLDLTLGDGNGFSLCKAIREFSQVPVIFLTASAEEGCTVAGFEVGGDDYISKPFRPRELVARIQNVLRRRTPETPKLLKCQSITADPSKGLVTKNGKEVFLSALEYRLLLLFLSNKGAVLSRDRLADELWTFSGEFIGDNTLNVYIKRLRDKIEDDPQNPEILKTVRGLGYKAVDE
ncbi:MAG: response regulator transcription factor [Oscillospiraceae bacterium]|nr:response regulator transcription factor [Oscillospiraceae bacterium]